MSKDKYRPSVSDAEVARLRELQPMPLGENAPPVWFGPYQSAERPVEEEEPDPVEWSPPAEGDIDDVFDAIEDELVEDDWFPRNLRVKSQRIKYNEQGRMRVDVTFEWDKLDSADGYFIRIAEAG